MDLDQIKEELRQLREAFDMEADIANSNRGKTPNAKYFEEYYGVKANALRAALRYIEIHEQKKAI